MNEPEDLREDVAEEAAERGVEIDPERFAALQEQMLREQSLPRALFAGILAGLVAAFVWGWITKVTEYEIGWIAIGVGFLVGFAMRTFGKGVTPLYQVLGAVLAGLSVAMGKIMAITMMVAAEHDVGAWELFSELSGGDMIAMLKETFSAMDFLFYAIALWAGWQYSLRQISEQELRSVLRESA